MQYAWSSDCPAVGQAICLHPVSLLIRLNAEGAMIRIRDLDVYLCPPTLSMRDAMARLNASDHLLQLVVDQDKVLVGTLTDGDVRRALLRGLSLDAAVAECMHAKFVAGRVGADTENRSLLFSDRRLVNFVPVVDGEGRVREVLIRSGQRAGATEALIMAGGFGRRLGERTSKTPKPLLPIGGRPILEHLLSRLEDAGIPNVYISLHHFADQIRSFVQRRNNRAKISFVTEDVPLGTAGALGRMAQPCVPILVMNGDVLTDVDVNALHDFHESHGFDATVGVAQYEIDVPFGVVRYNENGFFGGIEEKPRVTNFIAAGVYYLSPQFVSLVPRDRPVDMPELLNLGRSIGLRIGVFPIYEYWTDIGRPDDLDRAESRHRLEGTK